MAQSKIPSSMQISPWPLDYGWSTRQGHWTPHTDVLLEGRICSSQDPMPALSVLFSGLKSDQHPMVNAPKQSGYWAGGVFLYARAPVTPSSRAHQVSVWLHSRGEDAFDSIQAVSEIICRALREQQPTPSIEWVEHPHARDYAQRDERTAIA